MMRKWLAALLLISCLLGVCLPGMAITVVEGSKKDKALMQEDGVEMTLRAMAEWTIITPDNLNEHIALLTARGCTEEDVRYRYENGHIAFEAVHPKLTDGVVRMQVFEDAQSRSVWNLADITQKQFTTLKQELDDHLYQGYLRLFDVRYYRSEVPNNRDFSGSLNVYPPFAYESGLFNLRFFNGKAYLVSYVQSTQATKSKHYRDLNMYRRVSGWTPMNGHPTLVGEKRTAVADLLPAAGLILNAHSGAYTFRGITEKGAKVTVENGGRQTAAQVDGDGNYTAEIHLQPGENTVISTATKEKLNENALTRVIRVDDTLAALELTEYPYDAVLRDKIKVSGKASPGAAVTVKIDEGAAEAVALKKDGSFSYDVQAADWMEHDIEITAAEPGLTDCTARFTFRPVYEDASKGIKAFSKTLTGGVTGKKISAAPAGYVGSRVKIEVYTTGVQRQDGRLILSGNISKDKKMPILLICPDYLDDQILDKMILTVYGTVLEPSRTETPTPRIDVEYIQYHKTVYRKNAWY